MLKIYSAVGWCTRSSITDSRTLTYEFIQLLNSGFLVGERTQETLSVIVKRLSPFDVYPHSEMTETLSGHPGCINNCIFPSGQVMESCINRRCRAAVFITLASRLLPCPRNPDDIFLKAHCSEIFQTHSQYSDADCRQQYTFPLAQELLLALNISRGLKKKKKKKDRFYTMAPERQKKFAMFCYYYYY